MSDAIVSARGIVKSFQVGDRTLEVLHGVSLDVGRGEVHALLWAYPQASASSSTLASYRSAVPSVHQP